MADHRGVFRLPLQSGSRAGRARRTDRSRIFAGSVRQRKLGALARTDDPLLGVLLSDRLARGMAHRQLVQHTGSIRRHPPDPRQHLHPLDPQRANRQGRNGALSPSPRRRPRLAGGVEHAVHHVLRVLLPARVGTGGRCDRLGPLSGNLPLDSLDRTRGRRLLCDLAALLRRRDRSAQRCSRSA